MDEDKWGYLFGAALLAAASYWAFNNYEIKKRDPGPPKAVISPITPSLPRVTGVIEIGTAKHGSIWKIDADTVRGSRTNRQGWVTVDAKNDKTESYRERRTLYQVDCQTTAARELSNVEYDAAGKVLSTQSVSPEKAEVAYWAPDTFGSDVVDFLCLPGFDETKR